MKDKLTDFGVYIVKKLFFPVYIKIYNSAVDNVYDQLHYDHTEQGNWFEMPDELLEEYHKYMSEKYPNDTMMF